MKKTDLSNSTESTSTAQENMKLSPEVVAIKESLLLQKSEILNRDNEFKKAHLDSTKVSDEGDQTSQDIFNNISIHLHERERKSLLLIERTLAKINAGTYGECESCGDDISIKRLQARPLSPLCINCMEDLEDLKQSSGLMQ